MYGDCDWTRRVFSSMTVKSHTSIMELMNVLGIKLLGGKLVFMSSIGHVFGLTPKQAVFLDTHFLCLNLDGKKVFCIEETVFMSSVFRYHCTESLVYDGWFSSGAGFYELFCNSEVKVLRFLRDNLGNIKGLEEVRTVSGEDFMVRLFIVTRLYDMGVFVDFGVLEKMSLGNLRLFYVLIENGCYSKYFLKRYFLNSCYNFLNQNHLLILINDFVETFVSLSRPGEGRINF